MKRVTGYYATHRRHARARAAESALRRASRTHAAPLHPRRYRTQTHFVGQGAPRLQRWLWVGVAAAALLTVGLVAGRRSSLL